MIGTRGRDGEPDSLFRFYPFFFFLMYAQSFCPNGIRALLFCAMAVFPVFAVAQPEDAAGTAIDFEETFEPTPDWSFVTSFGYDSRNGNTDKDAVSAHAEAVKTEGQMRFNFAVDGAWETEETEAEGEKKDETTVNNVKASGNVKAMRNGYFLYFDASGLHDDIADIRYRFIESLGVGTFLWDEPELRFSVQGGVAYVQEDLGESDDYAALRVAERVDWIPAQANGVSFWESAEALLSCDGMERWLLNCEAGVDVPLFADLSLRFKWLCNYDSEPADDKCSTDRRFLMEVACRF